MLMLRRLLLQDSVILGVILLNAAVIFIQGFSPSEPYSAWLDRLDYLFTFIFLLEAVVKIRTWGARLYFGSPWNVLDFVLVLSAMPSLLIWLSGSALNGWDFLLILRVMRVFKFFRFVRFIPDIDHILAGVGRAARASVLLVSVFFIFNFILAMVACFLFRDMAPQHFGTPLHAFYSMFKVFTVEGWSEVPDALVEDAPPTLVFLIRSFFIVVFFAGGVLGLSIVNSIFVDSMVSDNNDALEAKVQALERKIDLLLEHIGPASEPQN